MEEPMTGGPLDGQTAGAEEPERRDTRWIWAALAAAVLLLLLWLLFQFVAEVPATVGMSRQRSVTLIEEAGFRSEVTTVPASGRLRGRVVAQAPLCGLVPDDLARSCLGGRGRGRRRFGDRPPRHHHRRRGLLGRDRNQYV